MSQAVDAFEVVTTEHNGLQLAELLNTRFAALLSTHSGPDAPAYAVEGMEWICTATTPYAIKRLVAGRWVTQGYLDPEAQVYVAAGLSAKADALALAAHVMDGGNPHSVTKAQVGLGNAENTADIDKPVSRAVQQELDHKANLASPALTGTPTAPTAAHGTSNTQIASTAFVQQELGGLELSVALAADPGLEFSAGLLRVKAGTGLVRSASGLAADVGVTAGKLLQLDEQGRMPAVVGAYTRQQYAVPVAVAPVAGAVTLDAELHQEAEITSSVALTMNAPTKAVKGMRLFLRLYAATALAIAWHAVFKANADVALPPAHVAGKGIYLDFRYDGASWVLMGKVVEA